MAATSLSKIEVAQRNLTVAIRLFFEKGDAVAIHTLAAAAQGVLRDIARDRNLAHTSILHDHPDVDPAERTDWIKALNASRNFFKHADKDPNGEIQFDDHENVLVLLDAVLILFELGAHTREAAVFIGWFTTANPQMRSALSGNQIGEYCVRNNISGNDLEQFIELLDSNNRLQLTAAGGGVQRGQPSDGRSRVRLASALRSVVRWCARGRG